MPTFIGNPDNKWKDRGEFKSKEEAEAHASEIRASGTYKEVRVDSQYAKEGSYFVQVKGYNNPNKP